MSPFQSNDELVSRIPTTPQGDQILGDPIGDNYSFVENNIISFSTSSNDKQLVDNPKLRSGKRRSERRDEYDIRRVMHRDVERKRRQEMSNLRVSLRSCLPRQNNKGKISVCDEIQMAVDYIKQMKENIKEMSIRRDKLRKLSNSSGTKIESQNGSDKLGDCVMVKPIQDGVEILISRSIKTSVFGLSPILAELHERELDVVSCISNRINGGFFHKIQIEARDITSLDIWMLQDRLANTIK